jgi:methionine sulfoxide reductase heme-binding subunit
VAAVTYRGLSPRTSVLRWGLAAIVAGTVIGVTAPAAASGFAAAWDGNRQGLIWLVERVLGFGAYIAMTASVVYGLLLSTKILDAIAHRPVSFALHKDLACIGVALAAVHGVLLVLDHSIPFTLAQVLVPFAAPHAWLAVAAGQIAFYLAAIVTASFYVRRRIGQRAWRVLHYTTFLAFVGATLHGLRAGSDATAAWAGALYLGSAVVVTFLLVYRIGMSLADRAAARRQGELVTARAELRRAP